MPEDTSAAASAMSPTDESGRLSSPTPLGPVAPAEPKKKRPFGKSLLFNMVSGGSAGEAVPDFIKGNYAIVYLLVLGCIEASIMHPLDLVKTRFQLQSNAAAATGLQVNIARKSRNFYFYEVAHVSKVEQQHYSSIADCIRKMYRSEGLFSFWKGVVPPVLVETPKRAWKVADWICVPFRCAKA